MSALSQENDVFGDGDDFGWGVTGKGGIMINEAWAQIDFRATGRLSGIFSATSKSNTHLEVFRIHP
jgi:hypothetical protein